MFKKMLEISGLFLFFVTFVAIPSAPITAIGWLITEKTNWNLWLDSTLVGLYGAVIGMLLHAVFFDKTKIGRRLLGALFLLIFLLLSTGLHARNLFYEPDLFPLLAFWWAIATAGFFFLSFSVSDNPAQAHNKTSSAYADR